LRKRKRRSLKVHQTEYRTVVLEALLGLRVEADEQGAWWVYRGDETLPATSDQVQDWKEILYTSQLRFEEAIIGYAAAEAAGRTRALFALIKGAGSEEGEL
jgi:hypothetical protein